MEQNHLFDWTFGAIQGRSARSKNPLKLQRIGKKRRILNVLPLVLTISRHAHLTKGTRVGIGVRKATNGCESHHKAKGKTLGPY